MGDYQDTPEYEYRQQPLLPQPAAPPPAPDPEFWRRTSLDPALTVPEEGFSGSTPWEQRAYQQQVLRENPWASRYTSASGALGDVGTAYVERFRQTREAPPVASLPSVQRAKALEQALQKTHGLRFTVENPLVRALESSPEQYQNLSPADLTRRMFEAWQTVTPDQLKVRAYQDSTGGQIMRGVIQAAMSAIHPLAGAGFATVQAKGSGGSWTDALVKGAITGAAGYAGGAAGAGAGGGAAGALANAGTQAAIAGGGSAAQQAASGRDINWGQAAIAGGTAAAGSLAGAALQGTPGAGYTAPIAQSGIGFAGRLGGQALREGAPGGSVDPNQAIAQIAAGQNPQQNIQALVQSGAIPIELAQRGAQALQMGMPPNQVAQVFQAYISQR